MIWSLRHGLRRASRSQSWSLEHPTANLSWRSGKPFGQSTVFSGEAYLAAASHHSGDYHGTEQVCRTLMQSLHDQPSRERFGLAVFPAVMSRAQLTRVLAERGVFDEGDAHGQEAIRIAEALDHPFSVVVGCLDLAYLKSVRGELRQAARLLERVVA
jgi:hypothetical protein